MAFTDIQMLRLEVADTDINFPILSDDEYAYLLEKNNDSMRTAALDAARIILLKLSINSGDQTVDIFSVKGSKAAEQYRESLKLFLKNPDLNPVLNKAMPYAGGISKADMAENIANPDNVLAPSGVPVASDRSSYFDI